MKQKKQLTVLEFIIWFAAAVLFCSFTTPPKLHDG